jgi:hypothetical protein
MENNIQKYSLGKKIWIVSLGVVLYWFLMFVFSFIYLFLILYMDKFNIKFLNNDTIYILYLIWTIIFWLFIFIKFVKNKTLFRKLLFWGFLIVLIFSNFLVYLLLHCSCRS